MSKRRILVVLFCAFGNILIAQNIQFNEAYQAIPGLSAISFNIQSAGSGYIIYGATIDSNNHQDPAIVKIDSAGNIVWQKSYYKSGYDFVPLECENELGVVVPWGGGMEVVSWENDTSASCTDWSLYRFDGNGDTLWTKNYRDSAGIVIDQIKITREKKYVIYGEWYDFVSMWYALNTLVLTKTDTLGNRIWTRTYHADSNHQRYPSGMDTCRDGGYVLCAFDIDTNASISRIFCEDGRIMVMKTDSAGNEQWTKYIRDTMCNVRAFSIKALKNGGYVLCGYWDDSLNWNGDSPYSIMYMSKLNDSGNQVWSKTYRAHWTGEGSVLLYNLNELPDGDLVVCGSDVTDDSVGYAGIIIRTDSNGNQKWYRPYEKFFPGDNDYLTDIQLTPDGGYISSGWTFSNPEEMWVVKTDSLGCDSGCNEVTGIAPLKIGNGRLTIFPNPNQGKFSIQLSVVSGQSSVEIYNVLGEKVYSKNYPPSANSQHPFEIDLRGQPNGVYLYRVLTENGNAIGEGKVVITK